MPLRGYMKAGLFFSLLILPLYPIFAALKTIADELTIKRGSKTTH